MVFDLRLKENFKIFISGPSGCGKTTFVMDLVNHLQDFSKSPPLQIVYFYTEWQARFREMSQSHGIIFIEDSEILLDQVRELSMPTFIIFDDMINSKSLKAVAQLYTVHGRHLNLSLAFISQRLFHTSEYFRQISQNSDYFCVFKNPRNSMEIRNLAMQITPKTLELLDIFRYATVKPYSYLFINLTQEAIPQLKYISNIFTRAHVIQAFVLTACK